MARKRLSEFTVTLPRGRGDTCVVQQDRSIVLAKERYFPVFWNSHEAGSFVECVREHETVENWTKIVTLQRSWIEPDLHRLLTGMIAEIKKEARDAFYRTFETTEYPILVFQALDPKTNLFEFDVFVFAKHESGNSFIMMQFAQRFTSADVQAGDEIRQAAVNEISTVRMSGFDPLFRK